jgi:Ankyrin repeats (3 copies)
MALSKSLPARPSQEFLRKEAKKLARDIGAGDPAALARARAQSPSAEMPLSLRDAQLVVAREYGYSGWQDLCAEVLRRLGKGLEWAADQAQRAIHDNDIERLRQLVKEYPELLTWHGKAGEVLLQSATSPYAMDVSDPEREGQFIRRECAELLLDAGAIVAPAVWENPMSAGAQGILQLLWSKGVLPGRLQIFAVVGQLEAVRGCFDESGALGSVSGYPDARTELNEAFLYSCRFKRRAIAEFLLERCIALDGDLGRRIDAWQGRGAFIDFLIKTPLGGTYDAPITPWRAFIVRQLNVVISNDDVATFSRWMESEPYLLDDSNVDFQAQLIHNATGHNRPSIIARLLELDPAVLKHPPPDPGVHGSALAEGWAHLVPLLKRIWPLPDDVPHAAGAGDFAAVKRWFDTDGKPALGDLNNHFPAYDERIRRDLHWGEANVQQVLDVAFAWACVNHHFEIAEFLLGHGADINTTWNTHEPASVLHIAAGGVGDYELARFLIDRGIDMTIKDYRWGGTAEGWAYNVGKDREMHKFLAREEEKRGNNKRVDESPPE